MTATRRSPTQTLREALAVLLRGTTPFVKARLGASLGLVVLGSALTICGPLLVKILVDRFATPASNAAPSAFLLIGLYVASHWLARVTDQARSLLYAQGARRAQRLFGEQTFAQVIRLPLKFHLQSNAGALSQAVSNGQQGAQMVFQALLQTVPPLLIELVLMVVILSQVAPPALLGLFCLALLAYAGAFGYSTLKVIREGESVAAAQISANALMTDAMLNHEMVKCLAAEAIVEHKVSQALLQAENHWVRFFRHYALNGVVIGTIFAAFFALAMLYAARETLAGRLTVGEFVLVNTFLVQVVRPVETIGQAMQVLSQGLGFLEKSLDLLREPLEPTAASRDATASSPRRRDSSGELEFEHVAYSYGAGRPVLSDVSFRLPPGRTLGIVGGSGSGKSTMVRLILRLLEVDRGRVLLDGQPVTSLPLDELRSAIALVPQDTILLNESIGFNIALGKRGSTQAEVERAARLAHLHEFIEKLPQGYETMVGQRGMQLSGGERQRVAIARAAIRQPRIYMFDEATSSLDSRTEQEIMRNLREISRETTTLVIAHRLATVVHADEIAVLDGGRIIERGRHAELIERGGRYQALWEAQHGTASDLSRLRETTTPLSR